jgi:uncharacterized protein
MKGRVLTEGEGTGVILALDEPLSFWGGFEPRTGVILDIHHPQRGACVKGTILLMRESKGSGSAPGAIAEAIRLGTAPVAIVLVKPDINIATGAEVAATLYGRHCAVLTVTEEDFRKLRHSTRAGVALDGTLSVD